MEIEMAALQDAVRQEGRIALDAVIADACRTINTGHKVIVHYRRNKDGSSVPPQVISSLEELEKWKNKIPPIHLKQFMCPLCGRSLRYMGEDIPDGLKCDDPAGCGTIFRLSLENGLRLMKLNADTGEEMSYPAQEL